MDIEQTKFLIKASQQAAQAGHVYPDMAACEAALESAYGTSALAIEGSNVFGTKQHKVPIYETMSLPTREYINGQYVQAPALWVKYPDLAACFADRVSTLKRLSVFFQNYNDALVAPNPIAYVTAVSRSWSTDPDRAAKCIAIYNEWKGL